MGNDFLLQIYEMKVKDGKDEMTEEVKTNTKDQTSEITTRGKNGKHTVYTDIKKVQIYKLKFI